MRSAVQCFDYALFLAVRLLCCHQHAATVQLTHLIVYHVQLRSTCADVLASVHALTPGFSQHHY